MMRGLIQGALVVTTLQAQDVRETCTDLDFAFSVEEDLAATDVVVSHTLVMHLV